MTEQPAEASVRMTGMQPALVSVVVPAFNGSQHIAQTLRSVAAQTHSAVEIIVVDDASTDDTASVVQSCGLALRYVRQPNAGVSAARNTGLALAQGDFVCFLDQDDVWHPQHLRHQLACFAAHTECGAVVSPYQHWYPLPAAADDSSAAFGWGEDMQPMVDPAFTGWVYHQFLLDCWALTSATLIRRDLLLRVGNFDTTLPFSEDWDLWLRLSREVQFVKLSGPPVLYRQHQVQGSRTWRLVDYRTRLLESTARAHGLASRDGRAVPAAQFARQLATYRMEFGYSQLQHGHRRAGVKVLWQAWLGNPRRLRWLGLAVAGSMGWRPRQAPST